MTDGVPNIEKPMPPCVANYRLNMNMGPRKLQAPALSDPVPLTFCPGGFDPFCEGGIADGGPDGTPKQTEFAASVGKICTAREWCQVVAGQMRRVEVLNPEGYES